MPGTPRPQSARTTRRRAVVGLSLAGVVLALWAVWWFRGSGEDPQITEIRSLQRELTAKYPRGELITSPQQAAARVAAMGQVMAKMRQLGPPQPSGRRKIAAKKNWVKSRSDRA